MPLMALPPAGFPKIRGRRCGEDWTVPTVVTGKLPKIPFGNQFKHTVEPITNSVAHVLNIADDEAAQVELATQIRAGVRDIDSRLRAQVPPALRFSIKETQQIAWLLAHALAELDVAEQIADAWRGYGWPLGLGDRYHERGPSPRDPAPRGRESVSCFSPSDPNEGAATLFPCPSPNDLAQRKEDRRLVGKRFSDALAHLYCAQYGYWRIRLYKEAARAYLDRPSAGGGDSFAAPTKDVDPCRDLGIGCPPGEEPDDCPTGLCLDPDGLPDPSVVPDADEPGDLGEPKGPPATLSETPSRAPLYIAVGGGVVLASSILFFALGRA